ncbi:MAG: hypothetical protein N3A01_07915 [Bacteroidales bacterium]|nr:hypothetical protein [Bacteroidales bacterium]
MKTKIISFFGVLICLILFNSCSFGQKEKSTRNQPQVDIKVNKKYDEKGNLIQYDSSYTYFWSNVDSNFIDTSIFMRFRDNFSDLFYFDNDSVFFKNFSFPRFTPHFRHFFDDDFFSFNFDIERELEKMRKMHEEMLKEHEQFFRKFMQPPLLIPAPEENNNDNKDLNDKNNNKHSIKQKNNTQKQTKGIEL